MNTSSYTTTLEHQGSYIGGGGGGEGTTCVMDGIDAIYRIFGRLVSACLSPSLPHSETQRVVCTDFNGARVELDLEDIYFEMS